jgi:hypothetical protein
MAKQIRRGGFRKVKKAISIGLFLVTLSLLGSIASANAGTPVINGVYPFAGVFMFGKDKPVVGFEDKTGFAVLGATIVNDLTPSWGFEATLSFIPDKDDSIYIMYYGNMITNLRITEVIYPYLTIGAGAITVVDPGDATTNLALNGGIGLKIRMTPSAHLRIDYRDFVHFLEDEVQHKQQITVGVGYAFNSVFFDW